MALGPAFQPGAFQEPEAFQTLAGIVTLAQASFGDVYPDAPEDAYWTLDSSQTSTLDVTPVFFPPGAAETVEEKAAQDYSEAYQWTLLDEDWTTAVFGFPDQVLDAVPATL